MPSTTLLTAGHGTNDNIFYAVFSTWYSQESICTTVATIRKEISALLIPFALPEAHSYPLI